MLTYVYKMIINVDNFLISVHNGIPKMWIIYLICVKLFTFQFFIEFSIFFTLLPLMAFCIYGTHA